jgi:hypothetical protein
MGWRVFSEEDKEHSFSLKCGEQLEKLRED